MLGCNDGGEGWSRCAYSETQCKDSDRYTGGFVSRGSYRRTPSLSLSRSSVLFAPRRPAAFRARFSVSREADAECRSLSPWRSSDGFYCRSDNEKRRRSTTRRWKRDSSFQCSVTAFFSTTIHPAVSRASRQNDEALSRRLVLPNRRQDYTGGYCFSRIHKVAGIQSRPKALCVSVTCVKVLMMINTLWSLCIKA